MQQKTAVYKGFIETPTFQTDTSLTSPDVFVITEFPERLTAGKNVIKFRGRENVLQPNSLISVEVLDYNGDPIYSEILANYIDEDKSRVIVIYIYEDTSPGDATVTLLSTLQNVPAEWRNKPNVKWTRSIAVNPTAPNISEIIFESEPTIQIQEQVGVQLNRSYTSGQFPTYSTGTITFTDQNFSPVAVVNGGTFTSDMVGGTLTVASPNNPAPTPRYSINNNTYTSTIKKLLSDTAIQLDSAYTVFSSQSIYSHTYNRFDASSYTIDYEATPTYTPTQNSESYAQLQIDGLEPASGDVSRIKVYTSGKGTVGTWELVLDNELEETELFIPSTSSVDPYVNVGYFTDQTIIDNYWISHTYLGTTETTAPVLTRNTTLLNNSVRVTPSVNIPRKNDVYVLQVSSSIAGRFIADSQYKVKFDARAFRDATSNNQNPKIYAYMSGSAFNYNTSDYYNQELPVTVGKKIGELEIRSESQRIDDETFYFRADRTGTGVLIFVIEAGDWYISEVRTTTDNDAGYTPNYTRTRIEIPTKHKSSNQLSFKIEYYNVDGVRSKLISYKNNLNWQGGNRYIDGDYSMITGSLYVADTLESGIAISGLTNTGFVRSLGYSGFEYGDPGFLLWSGSALPGFTTKGGVPYSGVGLELFLDTSSYFRYSTTDDELYVATKNFFLGDPNTSFISGSNSNIEISSSNFHLTADGDVTASSTFLQNYARADMFLYTIAEIDSAAAKAQYFEDYVYAGYSASALVLDGSLGGEAATQVRIGPSGVPNYPIGMIKPPLWPTPTLGSSIQIESAANFIYLALRLASGSGADFTFGFSVDSDDWHWQLWQTRLISGTQYGGGSIGDFGDAINYRGRVIELNPGQRIEFVKSRFDYRPLALNSYEWRGSDGLTQIYSGIATPDGPIYIGGAISQKIDNSAALQIDSNNQGVLLPRMTAANASAITATDGLVLYVTNTDATFTSVGFWGYESGAWVKL